jgi:hypothetical protein
MADIDKQKLRERLRQILSDLDEAEIGVEQLPSMPDPERVRKSGETLITLGRFDDLFALASIRSTKQVVVLVIAGLAAGVPKFNTAVTTIKNVEYAVQKGSDVVTAVAEIVEKAQLRPNHPADKFVWVPPTHRETVDKMPPNETEGGGRTHMVHITSMGGGESFGYATVTNGNATPPATAPTEPASSNVMDLPPGSQLIPFSEEWL